MTLKLCRATATAIVLGGPALAAGSDVTIVLQTQPDQLDPCQATKSHVGKVIKQNVVETITEIDPDDGTVMPRLATEWRQVDARTWRFVLREGVTFHDGQPFDAAALKHSIERVLDESLACEIRTKYFPEGGLTVTPLGEYEVEISTEAPQPILPKLLGTMVAMSPATPMGEYTRTPVGTGPYALQEWAPNERIVLSRFDGYWGDEPAVTSATYVWRSESAVRASMVDLGEADIAPQIAVQDATDPEMDYSYLNSETSRFRIDAMLPPLDDVRVRKALNLATDREGMRGSIFGQDFIPSTHLMAPGNTGYNPEIALYEYDPEEARRLLDEARADGVPVDTEIVAFGRYNLYPNAEEALQAQQAMWNAVGLNVRLQMTEAAEWFELFLKPFAEDRGPSVIQGFHDNNNGDAVFTVFGKYHSDGPQSTIDDPRVDRLIEEASAASGAERERLYQEMFRLIHDEIVPDVFLFHHVGYTRVHPRLDFTPSIATNSELQLDQISFSE